MISLHKIYKNTWFYLPLIVTTEAVFYINIALYLTYTNVCVLVCVCVGGWGGGGEKELMQSCVKWNTLISPYF